MEECSIYHNGKLIGFHADPQKLVDDVRAKRRIGEMPAELNVAYFPDLNEVYINTDAGRVMHPAIVVENGKPRFTAEHSAALKTGKLNWAELLKQGIVEYLDAEEEENALIAMDEQSLTRDHTHIEIHPSLVLGAIAAVAPFVQHNSSSRITMACAMLKQALGMYQSNYNVRMDTQAHVLYYPQKPIANTKHASLIGATQRPAGQNFVIAVMSHRGYNMLDAVILNKAAVERGLGRTTFYRTYSAEERRYPGGQKDRFELPKPEIQDYRGEEAYKFLGQDGIIAPECDVAEGNVLIGKTSPPRFLEEVGELSMIEEKRRENSVTIRTGEGGTVDSVLVTETTTGNKLIKVRVRTQKIPEIGDKFAARNGQKGVIGLIIPQEDMPFTEHGISPDLIMNPHAIPSRMTAGHVLEIMGAKAKAMMGEELNATAFEPVDYDGLESELKSYGFKPCGTEVLYDGITGQPMEAKIFMGICYYQRLKHLVSNKIHARSRGPVQILTRQPTEGRSRDGGLRFGEMERDCLIGHGSSLLLMERLLKESDAVTELVCTKCGMIAVDDQIRKKRYCPVCGDTAVKPIEISYAFKLLLNELKSMMVEPRIVLEDKA